MVSSHELASYIDHTLLRPDASRDEIEKLCGEALRYGFRAVCVNSSRVPLAAAFLQNSPVLVASVVGFPLGAEFSLAKAFETECAIAAGAREIDMVINLGALRDGDAFLVEQDIAMVVRAAADHPVKVILETGLLTHDKIAHACQLATRANATFVKTATGFLGRGATVEDIQIMRQNISPQMQIKASGGIRTLSDAQKLIAAGATRLGTSSGVALVTGQNSTTFY